MELPEKSLMRRFETCGLDIRDENWILNNVIDDTDFKGFGQYEKIFYVYLGKIDNEKEMKNYLEDLNVVLYRTEKEVEKMYNRLEEIKKEINGTKPSNTKKKTSLKDVEKPLQVKRLKKDFIDVEERIDLTNNIYVGFIINPEVKTDDFILKVERLLSKYRRYKLTYNKDDKIIFGDIEVNLKNLNSTT